MRRHDLAWLQLAAVPRVQPAGSCCAADPTAHAELAAWVAADHPLVVTRQPSGLAEDLLQLGLALPPVRGKRRLAFVVPVDAVLLRSRPPPLAELAEQLPTDWQPTLQRLLACPAVRAADPRLFGSAAMQVLTGEPCVGPDSDLDVLFAPPDRDAAAALFAALREIERECAQPRIDGEVLDTGGRAVAWRELAGSPERVLAKGLEVVELLERRAFLAGIDRQQGRAV